MQRERSICTLIIEANTNHEILTPLELKRLLVSLEPLDKKQIMEYLRNGLMAAIQNREQKKQQRVHSSVDVKHLQEKVDALVHNELKASFEEFEGISRDFERSNLG